MARPSDIDPGSVQFCTGRGLSPFGLPAPSTPDANAKKALSSFDGAPDLPPRCVSSSSTQAPISGRPSPDFPYSRGGTPEQFLADWSSGFGFGGYTVRPAAGSHLENPGTGEPRSHKAQRPATAPADKSKAAQQPRQQQQLQQQLQPRAPAGRSLSLQQRPGTAPPRGADPSGCRATAPHRRPLWPVPGSSHVASVTGCLVGCVDPARGLHHARCPNNPQSHAYALAVAGGGRSSSSGPVAPSPAAAARAVARPEEQPEHGQEVAPLGAGASPFDKWSPSRRLRGQRLPASARGPGGRPEPILGAPRPPSLAVASTYSAADPPPGILAAVLRELRRKAWRPEVFLQAREELLLSGRPDLLHQLIRAAREATERAALDMAYSLPGQGLLWQQERRKDLHGFMLDVPEFQWLGRKNIRAAFEMSYSMRARNITLTQSCPLDIVRELREKIGFKGPIIVVAEAGSFDDQGGGVDLSAPGGGLWPEELTLRTDAARFLAAAAEQSKRCHHQATIHDHLTDHTDPYMLRLARVTLMRGTHEEGYPFLEDPLQFTVLTTANANPRPAVRNVKFRKRPQMEWYRNPEENSALIERLNLLGEVARLEQTFLDQADGIAAPGADGSGEGDEMLQYRSLPVLIFGMPGSSEAMRHPRDAVANAVKHWRRQFSSSFHQVYMCCRGRGGGDPGLANHAGTIANRDPDAEYLAQALGDPTVHSSAATDSSPGSSAPNSPRSPSRNAGRSSQFVLTSVPSLQTDVFEAASALAATSEEAATVGLNTVLKAKMNQKKFLQQTQERLVEEDEEDDEDEDRADERGEDGGEADEFLAPLTYTYGVPSSGTTLKFDERRSSSVVSTYAALQLNNPTHGTNEEFDVEKHVHTPAGVFYAEERKADLMRKCESLDEKVGKHVQAGVQARQKLAKHASAAAKKKKGSVVDEGGELQLKANQRTLADYGISFGDDPEPRSKQAPSRRASAGARLQTALPRRGSAGGGGAMLRAGSEAPGSMLALGDVRGDGKTARSRSCEIEDREAFKTYQDWERMMEERVQEMRHAHWLARESLRDRGRRMSAKMEILKRTIPLPSSHSAKKALGTTDLVLGFAASAGDCSSGFYKPPWGTKLSHKEKVKQMREEVFHATRSRLRKPRTDAEGRRRATTDVTEYQRAAAATGSEEHGQPTMRRAGTEPAPPGQRGEEAAAAATAVDGTATEDRFSKQRHSRSRMEALDGSAYSPRVSTEYAGRPAREVTIASKALAAAFSGDDPLLAGLPSVADAAVVARGSIAEKSFRVDHSHDSDNPVNSGVPWNDPRANLRRMVTMPGQLEGAGDASDHDEEEGEPAGSTQPSPSSALHGHSAPSRNANWRVSFAAGSDGGGSAEPPRRPSAVKAERKSFVRKSIQEAFGGIGIGRLNTPVEASAEENISRLEGQIQDLAASLESAKTRRATITGHAAGHAGAAMRATPRRSMAASSGAGSVIAQPPPR